MIARPLAVVALLAALVSAADDPLRLGSLAWRHAGSVTGAAFVDGGARLVTASLDGTCVLRDAGTGEVVETFVSDADAVVGVSAGGGGARVAIVRQIGLDDFGDAVIRTLVLDRSDESVERMDVDGRGVLSADGRRLAVRVDGEHEVVVLDVETGARVAAFDPGRPDDGDEPPMWIALSSDGAALFAGGRRAPSRREISTWFVVHPVDGGVAEHALFHGAPAAFALGPHGLRAAAAIAGGEAHVFDTTGDLVATYALGGGPVTALALVDDARVVTSDDSSDVVLRVADARGDTVELWTSPSRMPVTGLVVDPAGGRIAPTGRAADVALLSLDAGRALTDARRHPGRVTSVAIAPGGEVVVTGGWTGEVMAWDAASGARVGHVETAAGTVRGLGFLADDRFVLVAGVDGRLVVLDREADLAIVADEALGEPILAMDVAPDGRRVATGHRGGVVRVWAVDEAGALGASSTFAVGERHVTSLDWSPDGARLAVAVTSLAHVVDAASGEVLATHAPRCPIADVAWAADRIALALATRRARVLDAADLGPVFDTPRLATRVEAVALAPDGARVAVAVIGSGDVQVFDGAGGEGLRLTGGHAEDVSALAWGARRIAVASADGTATVWAP